MTSSAEGTVSVFMLAVGSSSNDAIRVCFAKLDGYKTAGIFESRKEVGGSLVSIDPLQSSEWSIYKFLIVMFLLLGVASSSRLFSQEIIHFKAEKFTPPNLVYGNHSDLQKLLCVLTSKNLVLGMCSIKWVPCL